MTPAKPYFEAPWHAQVFAITVHLHETGAFTWPDWTAAFGDTLKTNGLSTSLDGGDDYFLAWIETLERVLCETGQVDSVDLSALKSAWTEAYLTTAHGQPVTLTTG